MSQEPQRQLRGLARSISSLFDRAEGGPMPTPADGSGVGLSGAVEAFLVALPGSTPEVAEAVRREARVHVEGGDPGPVAEVVERLVLHGGALSDPAALALGRELVGEEVSDALVERLASDREEGERARRIDVCRRLGGVIAPALARALSANPERAARRACVDAMVALGDAAAPVVEAMVEDPRWYVVRNGVAVLAEGGGPRAVELVVSALAHADARVRREAVRALGKVGGEDAAQLVLGMLEDTDAEVRLAAALAAGALEIERALKPLLNLLDDTSDPDLVVGILKALGRLGDPGAVNAIEKRAVGSFLSRPSVDVRIAAYRALHAIATPHAKSLLVRAADDKDPAVKAAVRGLLRMR